MRGGKQTYSQLNEDEQAALSIWIEEFAQQTEESDSPDLSQAVSAAPPALRAALLAELLPAAIDFLRKKNSRTPTLHELRLTHPDLTSELPGAYARLSEGYRLPTELHGYRVVRVIGHGGQSVVLRAQDDVHSVVAIKLSRSREHNELLLRERRLLGECSHPGIPSVIASGLYEGRAYFVMPFLQGASLLDRYQGHRPDPIEAARIVSDLCGIVEHLHARGVLHRDIKPANVWVDDRGNISLLDLGMAIEQSAWGQPRPAIQQFHGTPAFMSPEQANANSDRDGKLSDVFSLGGTLFWLITGQAPFAAEDRDASLAKAQAGRIAADSLTSVSRPLRRACQEAIAIDPSNRCQSASELGAKLHQVATGKGKRANLVRVMAVACSVGIVALLTLSLRLPIEPREDPSEKVELTGQNEPSEHKQQEPPPLDAIPQQRLKPIIESDWIQRTAERRGIDISAISRDDFVVRVRTALRTSKPWASNPYRASQPGVLEVIFNQKIEPIAESFQYRVGEGPWRPLRLATERFRCEGELFASDIETDGEIQIRVGGSNAAVSAGPFAFPADLQNDLVHDASAFRDELVIAALDQDCVSQSGNGWEIYPEYARRYGSVIRELRIGSSPATPFRSISVNSKNVLLNQAMEQPYRLEQRFVTESRALGNAQSIWIEIDFINGQFQGLKRYRHLDAAMPAAVDRARRKLAGWPLSEPGEFKRFELAPLNLSMIHWALDSVEIGKAPYIFDVVVPVIDQPSRHELKSLLAAATPEEKPGNRLRDKSQPYRTPAAYFWGGKLLAPISVPPIWERAFYRGRYKDGSTTPVYELKNQQPLVGFEIDFVRSPKGVPTSKAYAYLLATNQDHTSEWPGPDTLTPNQMAAWKRTSLHFHAIPPLGPAWYTHLRRVRARLPNSDIVTNCIEIPYLDRYGREIGSGTFCVEHSKFRHAFFTHLKAKGISTTTLPAKPRLSPIARPQGS